MKQSGLSVLQRFQSLSEIEQQKQVGTIRSINAVSSGNSSFDPVLTFQQSCSCPHRHQNHGAHVCNSIARPASRAVSESSSGSSVAETYSWLINAGVPFSAFDPIAIEPTPIGPSDHLYDCADEIASLFSFPSAPKSSSSPTPTHYGLVSSSLDSPVSEPSFGFNGEDASLEIPQDMLGDLSTAIWGL